jgi:hypothetical protein
MKIPIYAGSKMDFNEKKLYRQIHPVKLATDIGVTPIFLFFVWQRRIAQPLSSVSCRPYLFALL